MSLKFTFGEDKLVSESELPGVLKKHFGYETFAQQENVQFMLLSGTLYVFSDTWKMDYDMNGKTVKNVFFFGYTGNCEGVEFQSCGFYGKSAGRFDNCVLDGCEIFSGRFENCTVTNSEVVTSKSANKLYNSYISIEPFKGPYSNFRMCKISSCAMDRTDIHNSTIIDSTTKNVEYVACRFSGCKIKSGTMITIHAYNSKFDYGLDKQSQNTTYSLVAIHVTPDEREFSFNKSDYYDRCAFFVKLSAKSVRYLTTLNFDEIRQNLCSIGFNVKGTSGYSIPLGQDVKPENFIPAIIILAKLTKVYSINENYESMYREFMDEVNDPETLKTIIDSDWELRGYQKQKWRTIGKTKVPDGSEYDSFLGNLLASNPKTGLKKLLDFQARIDTVKKFSNLIGQPLPQDILDKLNMRMAENAKE